MGCAQSTEGVVISKGDGNPPAGGNEQLQSTLYNFNVPAIPGWDGFAIATLPMTVEFEMKGTWGGIKTSMEPLLNTIMAQNIAGTGHKLAAVFLPVLTQGKHKGQPMDLEHAGWNGYKAKAMCIFQKDLHGPGLSQETLFLQAPMEVKVKMWSSSAIEVEGYEGLYGQLAQAGWYTNVTQLLS